MKNYYVVRGNFSNAYALSYVETEEDALALPQNAERITRKEAIRLATSERFRAKCLPNDAGYADDAIYPASWDKDDGDIRNNPNYVLRNYIWERVN